MSAELISGCCVSAELITECCVSAELIKQRQLRAADLPPPDTAALAHARDQRLKEVAMEAILKECIVYFFFILVLFFLSYQVRDADSFRFASNVKNHFWAVKYGKV